MTFRLSLIGLALLLAGCTECAQKATREVYTVCWRDAWRSGECWRDIYSYELTDDCITSGDGRTRCGSFDITPHAEEYCYFLHTPR